MDFCPQDFCIGSFDTLILDSVVDRFMIHQGQKDDQKMGPNVTSDEIGSGFEQGCALLR